MVQCEGIVSLAMPCFVINVVIERFLKTFSCYYYQPMIKNDSLTNGMQTFFVLQSNNCKINVYHA